MKLTWGILICLSISIVLADVLIASLYNTILIGLPRNLVLPIYIFLSFGFIIIFWNILILARLTPIEIKGHFMKVSQKTSWLLQSVISIFVVFLLVEVVYKANYTQAVSSFSELSGLLGGIIMLAILVRQLLFSFQKFRSTILFLFSLAMISTLSYFVIMSGLTYLVMSDKPVKVARSWLMTHVYLQPESIQWVLSKIVPYMQITSFLILWVASAYLFRYQFERKKSMIFIILILTPTIYFLGRLVDVSYFTSILIPLIDGNNVTESIVRIVVRTVSPLIGGIIFGLSFYYSSRSLPRNSKLRTYLNITGHGIIILLISSQYNTILQYPYPPFGTIALSSSYMGSYLLLVGIYATALSSAQNIKIHNEISKIIHERSRLSHEMGNAFFIEGIEKQVSIIEENMVSESGVESASDAKEIRKYIQDVLEEKRKHGRKIDKS